MLFLNLVLKNTVILSIVCMRDALYMWSRANYPANLAEIFGRRM